MAIQERNSEMVNLLSVDFVRKKDTTYLAGIVTGAILALPGLTAFWPMQVALNDDDLQLLPEGGSLITGGSFHALGTGFILGVSSGAGGYTALTFDLSAASGGNAAIQAVEAAGSAYGDLRLNPGGGDVQIAAGGGLTSFGGTIGEAWNDLSFVSGWGNLGGGWATGQYKKIGDMVFLRGFVVRTSGVSAVIATLPAGYRPPTPDRFAVTSDAGGFANIQVSTDGTFEVIVGSPTNYMTLSGIIFSTV